jgi:hypothetical protein
MRESDNLGLEVSGLKYTNSWTELEVGTDEYLGAQVCIRAYDRLD